MPGRFILTLDTELAWGTFDKNGLKKYRKHFKSFRQNTDRLIALLEKYQIKATWAFVGQLLLESQKQDDYLWRGRDLLKKVGQMAPAQEIATHTFSHAILGDKNCSQEKAYWEIKKCLDLAKEENIPIQSLVFPRNSIGHLDILKELGLKCFRGVQTGFFQNFSGPAKRFFSALDQALALSPPVYALAGLKKHSGVLEIPASMFLMPYDGLRKLIPGFSRRHKAGKGLEKAVAENSIFHLWFHPFNLGSSPKMLEDLEEILKAVRKKIDAGELINQTMAETTDSYEKDQNRILILSSYRSTNYFFINKLSQKYNISYVVYEKNNWAKNIRLLNRRIKKLGLGKVLGQIIFILFDRLYIKRISRPKIDKLLAGGKIYKPGLPSIEVSDINGKEVEDLIRRIKPCLIIVSGVSIIKPNILSLAETFINIHCGITPRYRGVHGGFWAIYNNDFNNIGTTVHLVDKGIDTGRILYSDKIQVDPRFDDFRTIVVKQYIKGAELMDRAVEDALNNNLKPVASEEINSRLWFHPTIIEYLSWRRIFKNYEFDKINH